jgi:hypothetical protein
MSTGPVWSWNALRTFSSYYSISASCKTTTNLSILIGFVKLQVPWYVRRSRNHWIIIPLFLLSFENLFLKTQDVNKIEKVLNPRHYSSYAHHNISTCMRDYRRGFGLDIGFIDYLYTQLVSTSIYSPTLNLHTSKITTAPAKPFPACRVFTSRYPLTASNSGDSSASDLKSSLNVGSLPTDSFLHSLPYRTDLDATVVFLITPRHGPRRKHAIHCHVLIVPTGMRSRHPATGLHATIFLMLLVAQCNTRVVTQRRSV